MKALIFALRHAIAVVIVSSILSVGQKSSAGESPGQWILVTPPAFRTALTPLIQHRREEGFDVVVLETTNVLTHDQLEQREGSPLQARLDRLFQKFKGPHYVLLAGTSDATDPAKADRTVVPGLHGKVGRMKGQPCDVGYGLPDQDGAPAVAVGRFPARNVEELSAMVRKTLSFEQNSEPAPWRDRLVLLLGNPGGGRLAEWYIEQTFEKNLGSLYPGWEVRILLNASSSSYYLPRPEDRKTTLQYLRDGALFSVYLGHSGAQGLGLDARFIPRGDWAKLDIPRGQGPFFTCGCFACQREGPGGQGYGLIAMRNPQGPVAVIGATGESYSAPGELAAEGLLTCLKHPPFPSRLGEYWLAVQAGLARGKMDQTTFALLDMVDGTGGKVPLATQRLEHLEMWQLLGDPALRMPIVPADISLQASKPIVAGKTATVTGLLPDRLRGAPVRVTLERPLNSQPAGLKKPPANTPENRDARERVFIDNHRRANSFILTSAQAKTSGAHFVATVEVPADLAWTNLVLKATSTREHDTGLGVLPVSCTAAKP